MIKCKNCVNFKEHSSGEYECLKIYNITINDKEFKHDCQSFIDKVSVFSLYNVSHQRVLLLAFMEFMYRDKWDKVKFKIGKKIDEFFKANNCG